MRFLEMLPEEAVTPLSETLLRGQFDLPRLKEAFAAVDWVANRNKLEGILSELLPVEELVPPIYEQWRPVVRDGFGFIAARLSPDRLIPKIIEQLRLPPSTPMEDRFIAFIRRVPVLQKIGQTLARNANLDPSFRSRLIVLEDGIHDVEENEIRAEVESQLSALLAEHRVNLQPGIYGEGSVSALLRFTSRSCPGMGPTAGVFKVLKPFIPLYFREDLDLLGELANYFYTNQEKYDLGKLNLRTILDDVRELYEREIDFIHEREHLIAARSRYVGVKGLRIPQPIGVLSNATITAMTEERGVKITEAYPGDLLRRKELARRLIEYLVARPLFQSQEISPFHADPHVGNLRVDEATGDVVLLDWALTGTLTTVDRRSLILLLLTLPLRDEGQILEALSELSLPNDAVTRDLLKRQIEIFVDALPLASIPNPGRLGELVDGLLRAGARFSGSFLIFRKVLSTVEDVIEQVSPGLSIQQVVLEYALTNGLLNAWAPGLGKTEFNIPLRGSDLVQLGLSAQLLLPRVWAQTARSIARKVVFAPRETKPRLELV
jgi:ubiquinone biosynthesis protein